MSERVMGRRQVLLGAGVAAGGVALTGLSASPAAADEDKGHGLSGSWLVTRQDDPPGDPTVVKAVFSFADGDVLVEHDINPAGPPFTGTWASRRHDEFTATIWSGFAGGPGGVRDRRSGCACEALRTTTRCRARTTSPSSTRSPTRSSTRAPAPSAGPASTPDRAAGQCRRVAAPAG